MHPPQKLNLCLVACNHARDCGTAVTYHDGVITRQDYKMTLCALFENFSHPCHCFGTIHSGKHRQCKRFAVHGVLWLLSGVLGR